MRKKGIFTGGGEVGRQGVHRLINEESSSTPSRPPSPSPCPPPVHRPPVLSPKIPGDDYSTATAAATPLLSVLPPLKLPSSARRRFAPAQRRDGHPRGNTVDVKPTSGRRASFRIRLPRITRRLVGRDRRDRRRFLNGTQPNIIGMKKWKKNPSHVRLQFIHFL